MLSPKAKQFIFKLLVAVFIPDKHSVYRQHIEARIMQLKLNQFLRNVNPNDLQVAKLQHLAERMSDLQKLIYLLCEKGFTDEEIAQQLNIPLHKIQKHLNLIEQEIFQLFRYKK